MRPLSTQSLVRQLGILGALSAACLAPADAHAHEGWGIVRDALGRLYVTDIPANTVWRIDANGRVVAVRRNTHSHTLMVGTDGAIYGTHVHLTQPIRGVWRLDMTGRSTEIVPQTRGLPLDLQPFLLAADRTIYSVSPNQPDLPANQRQLFVLRRSPAGVIDTIAGGLKGYADGDRHNARFSSIDGMAWLADSSLLLVDGARLRRLTRDGTAYTLTSPLTEFRWDQDLMGVNVAPDGRVLVADFSGRRVLRTDGEIVSTVASTGGYWAPTGVLATSEGIYTLEHPRAPLGILGDLAVGPYLRVRFIPPNGSAQTITRLWGRNTKYVLVFLIGVVAIFFGVRLLRRRRSSAGAS